MVDISTAMRGVKYEVLTKHLKAGHNDHKVDLQQSFDSQLADSDPLALETMNLNVGYLLSIMRLIDEYVIAEISFGKFENDVQRQKHLHRILKSVYRLLKCKMSDTNSSILKNELKKINDNIHTSVTTNNEGEMYIDPDKTELVDDALGEVFESLLVHMEQRGMLTYKKDDPMTAMSKFSD